MSETVFLVWIGVGFLPLLLIPILNDEWLAIMYAIWGAAGLVLLAITGANYK